MQCNQDHTSKRATHKQNYNYNCSAPPQGASPHITLPSPGVLYQENEPLGCWALKTAGFA